MPLEVIGPLTNELSVVALKGYEPVTEYAHEPGYGSGAVVSSWYLLVPASKPKSGTNSTYPCCPDFPSQLFSLIPLYPNSQSKYPPFIKMAAVELVS
jgi:hypothetical protein